MSRKPKIKVELDELDAANARIVELEAELMLLRSTTEFAAPANEIVPAVVDQPRSVDPAQYGPAVLQMLERAAFFDVGTVIDFGSQGGVKIKSSADLPPEIRQLVTEVKEDKDGNVIIKFVSKDLALRLLGQASGVIKETTINNNNTLNVGLLEVLKTIDGTTRGLPKPLHKHGNGHG